MAKVKARTDKAYNVWTIHEWRALSILDKKILADLIKQDLSDEENKPSHVDLSQKYGVMGSVISRIAENKGKAVRGRFKRRNAFINLSIDEGWNIDEPPHPDVLMRPESLKDWQGSRNEKPTQIEIEGIGKDYLKNDDIIADNIKPVPDPDFIHSTEVRFKERGTRNFKEEILFNLIDVQELIKKSFGSTVREIRFITDDGEITYRV